MSVEALASAWARTDDAPDGAVVVIGSEISGRLRGGIPWRLAGDDALMMAMVVRPALNPLQEPLLWLVATLAAADALVDVSGEEHGVIWPDSVVSLRGENLRSSINVIVQLGPGRIEHAVLAVRTSLDGLTADKKQLLEALEHRLSSATRLVESDALVMLETFNDRCSIINRQARVSLLPRGEARGRVAAVDPDGFIVLESPTGMLERIAPAALRSLELID